MNKTYKIALAVVVLLLLGFLAWYFATVVTYILISLVITFMGQPLAGNLSKIGIGKRKLGRPAGSMLSLLMILFIITFYSLNLMLLEKMF